ncbi:MAG: LAGLIDADG family homing endonuclease [Patescibacteria group bacterium]|nr:LAGLIDADG family homing endonuclease [Patescibacteria group bacterium]MDD5172780.1 LAGLIDADG family homing endonuclease [Patescibacteria group bacterium]
MSKIPNITNVKNLSFDFIAGLICENGYFSWTYGNKNSKNAVFQIRMRHNDKKLLFALKNSLGLKESIYEYEYQDKTKTSIRRHQIVLLVRKREVIKKIIIPALDGRLYGLKEKQFNKWKKEFFKQEKKWQYHYVEKLSKSIQPVSKLTHENFEPKMIGTEKL